MSGTEGNEISDASGKALSTKELAVLSAIFKSMPNPPAYADLDRDKFIELAGYGSVASGRNAYTALMKKIADPAAIAAAKATPRKKKASKQAANDIDEDDAVDPATPGAVESDGNAPPATPKTGPAKRTAKKAPDGESPTKKPRAPPKAKVDADGNVVAPKRGGRQPKVDENGNRVNPPRKPRAPKAKSAPTATAGDDGDDGDDYAEAPEEETIKQEDGINMETEEDLDDALTAET